MNAVRARKEAAKRLGIALQMQYRLLLEARTDDEIAAAAVELGNTFNKNIEFTINVLKSFGGLDVTFEPMTRPAANDAAPKLPQTPAIFAAGRDVDLPRAPHLLHNGE